LKFSSFDAIEALYEFCNAAMYREHKIRNMNAYLLNIIRRREAVREFRGRDVYPRKSSHRLDENTPHVGASPSSPTNRQRVRESLSGYASTPFRSVDTANERGMKQKKSRGKIWYRSPLSSPIPVHAPAPMINEQFACSPQRYGFITPPGSIGDKGELKNTNPEIGADYRGRTIEGLCVVKSTSVDRSHCQVKNSTQDKSFSVFCCKEKPAESSCLSPTLSMTTDSLEVSHSEPFNASFAPSSPALTGEEERPCKFSAGSGTGEKKTCQAYTIHNLPILMDHYIVSTLSEYIFSC